MITKNESGLFFLKEKNFIMKYANLRALITFLLLILKFSFYRKKEFVRSLLGIAKKKKII